MCSGTSKEFVQNSCHLLPDGRINEKLRKKVLR
jgi:hypothetical protein